MVVKGKKLTQKEYWQKLKSELKEMTPRQKLEHLWEYYKWVLGVVFIAVVVIAAIVGSILTKNTETILTGATINVTMDLDGYNLLKDGYYQRAKTEGRQAVGLTNFNFLDPYSTVEQTYTWNIIDNVTSMIGSDNLDYLMFDELSASFFMSPDNFADLRELFSEEELAAMGNAVVTLKIADTGEELPIAIDIRDTVFYIDHVSSNGPIYLAFSSRLPRKAACQDFWQYIKGGKTQLLQTVLCGTAVDAPLKEEGKTLFTKELFAAQECTEGDHRVVLSQQSFLSNVDYDGDDLGVATKENVGKTLKEGSLDYILCGEDAFGELEKEDLLDLRQLLTETQLQQLQDALVLQGETPIAVDISTLPYGQKYGEGEPLYLAFSAKTGRLQVCKDLWNMIIEKEE